MKLEQLKAEAAAILSAFNSHSSVAQAHLYERGPKLINGLLAAMRKAETSERLCRDAIAETIKRYPENDAAVFVACAVAPLAPITQADIAAINADGKP